MIFSKLSPCFHTNSVRIIGAIAAGSLLYLAVKHLCGRKRKQYAKDTVILHQFARGKNMPSLSPFPIKVETFLRIAKIPYETDFDDPMGPKGKCPWISYNDLDIADSQICINFLKKQFNIDLNPHLTGKENSISTAFQILAEEHFYWCMIMERYVYDKECRVRELCKIFPQYKFVFKWLSKALHEQAKGQGMGRHTQQEVYEFAKADLKALSDFLGNNKYFFGEKVSEVDCALFGTLAQCVWGLPGSYCEDLVNGEFSNLKAFCMTMKEEWWPDWDEIIEKN